MALADTSTRVTTPALDVIPDEILQLVLYFISPEENLRGAQLASRRFHRLANEPLLWRYHCRHAFVHWSPAHDITARLAGRVSEVDWKSLFIQRKKTNFYIAQEFDHVVATKLGRSGKYEQICLLGNDAKDFLMEQSHTSDDAEDVLARR